MPGRRGSPTPEDPSVSVVEQILATAADRAPAQVSMRAGRAVVDRAVWFCCCVTEHDADAPTWLVYDTAEGGFGWCRVPDRVNESSLVDAALMFGDHVHPKQVLAWLQGAEIDRSFDLGSADIAVLRELGRKIRDLWVS